MNEFSEQGSNISKRLNSCQLFNEKFLKDTLLVIVNEREESKGNTERGK